jgi:phospholipid/cholesterol/gamma-HCH transport system substrate-binding protein
MKNTLKSEVKIGLIVITAFAIFVWGLNYLKGVNLLKPINYYNVYYNQIDGLVKSSPVMLDGFQVGLVKKIEYQYDQPGRILVSLDLNKKLNVPKGTTAILKSALMGNPSIELILGNAEKGYLENGDTLLSFREPGLMDQLNSGLLSDIGSLVQRADSLLASVESLVEDGSLKSTLYSLEKTSHDLEHISGKLDYAMTNEIPAILKNINTMTAEFSGVGNQINQIDLKGTMSRFDKVLDDMGALTVKLNSTDNSMGLLLNDRSLYNNLSNTAGSANLLLLDLKEKPKRYVHFSIFGSGKK